MAKPNHTPLALSCLWKLSHAFMQICHKWWSAIRQVSVWHYGCVWRGSPLRDWLLLFGMSELGVIVWSGVDSAFPVRAAIDMGTPAENDFDVLCLSKKNAEMCAEVRDLSYRVEWQQVTEQFKRRFDCIQVSGLRHMYPYQSRTPHLLCRFIGCLRSIPLCSAASSISWIQAISLG